MEINSIKFHIRLGQISATSCQCDLGVRLESGFQRGKMGGCRWVLVLGKKVTKQTGWNGCVFTELMTLTDSKETKTQGARGQVETLQNEGIFCDNI